VGFFIENNMQDSSNLEELLHDMTN